MRGRRSAFHHPRDQFHFEIHVDFVFLLVSGLFRISFACPHSGIILLFSSVFPRQRSYRIASYELSVRRYAPIIASPVTAKLSRHKQISKEFDAPIASVLSRCCASLIRNNPTESVSHYYEQSLGRRNPLDLGASLASITSL